jgi:hypothetical protein
LWLTGRGVWRYALLELFALGYFFLRWSARRAQHKQFHFLMLGCYVTTTAFYSYQLALQPFMPDAFAMSGWHYQLLHNSIFVAQLMLVILYGVLYRRAHADRGKYYAEVDSWFGKAGAARRGFIAFLRRTFVKAGKP